MDNSTAGVVPARTSAFRVGDVLGRSFELFGRQFAPFFGLTLVAYIPTFILALLAGPRDAALDFVAFVSGIAAMVCSVLASAAVTYGVVQELRGRSFTFSESLAVAARRFLPMIGVALCYGFLVGIGFVLLIVPGIILGCMYYVAPQACLLERTGVFASLSRSAALTKGHRWQIFGILLVVFLTSAIVTFLLGLILSGAGATVTALVGALWQALVGAFGAVLGGVLYFQLRSVKEGFDIDQIASVFD
jgi:hypothetical protein